MRSSRFVVLVVSFFLLSSSVSTSAFAVEEDKQLHAGMSFGMGSVCSFFADLISENPWIQALTCFAVVSATGGVKEIVDPSIGGNRDLKDMYANLIGAGAGATTAQLTFAAFPNARPTIRPRPRVRPLVNVIEAKPDSPVLRLEMKDGEILETRYAKSSESPAESKPL